MFEHFKFKYFIYTGGIYVEASEILFKSLLNFYSESLIVYKYDYDFNPYCESVMTVDEPLFYYLYDSDSSQLYHFGKVEKISDD